MIKLKQKIFWLVIVLLCGVAAVQFRERLVLSQKSSDDFVARIESVLRRSPAGVNRSGSSGVSLRNLEIKDPANLPPGSVLKIQRVFLNATRLTLSGLVVEIEHGRLILPNSEPVIFNGSVRDGAVDFNMYSRNVDLANLASFFPSEIKLRELSGNLKDVDVVARGLILKPRFTGGFVVEKLKHNRFSLTGCPVGVDLAVEEKDARRGLYGQLVASKGMVVSKVTTVHLAESKIFFKGDVRQPSFNITGQSKIERTVIRIIARGTLDKPELSLSSIPSFPQEQLLMMLATGRNWSGVNDTLSAGTIAPDVAKQFIDYFVLGGQGSALGRQLGISDVSLKFEKDTRGVTVKKEVFDKLEVGYGLEQVRLSPLQDKVTQTFEGEWQLTDQISVGAERELQYLNKNEGTTRLSIPQQPNDKFYMQFKKWF